MRNCDKDSIFLLKDMRRKKFGGQNELKKARKFKAVQWKQIRCMSCHDMRRRWPKLFERKNVIISSGCQVT